MFFLHLLLWSEAVFVERRVVRAFPSQTQANPRHDTLSLRVINPIVSKPELSKQILTKSQDKEGHSHFSKAIPCSPSWKMIFLRYICCWTAQGQHEFASYYAPILHHPTTFRSSFLNFPESFCDTTPRFCYAKMRFRDSERIALKYYLVDYRGLLAPIRRMPNEVLGEIFGFCADDLCEDPRWRAVERLAQKPLLTLSRVCKRWHDVALGTPGPDTIILGKELGGPETQTPEMMEKLVRLLEIFLDRGEETSLRLVIWVDNRAMLELFAQYFKWWKTLTFFRGFSSPLHHSAGAKGRLPWLETLKISTTEGTSQTISTFEAVPRLRNLEFPAFLLPSLPLSQLSYIGYSDSHFSSPKASALDLLPVSSNIGHLSLELPDFFGEEDIIQIVEAIFKSLTLPHLCELSFQPKKYRASQTYWPQTAFLDLTARSSFTQLWSLHLRHIVVADTDLIACLLALPVLEALSITDHLLSEWDERESEDGNPFEFEHHLITDALLSRLTLKPDSPAIVHHLRILELGTLFQFDHTVFLEFLLFRRVEQPSNSPPLLLGIYICRVVN
ncbi:F-box domain-containing protein [Mycena sanguinolenta]|uniref:F-box domain-containing protein n=1 Tax=Mycena sanguinolenta TaxID=230812 RepID=A0A8H6X662_9AGAR|nr:F-box domain-containing protein [Mycena sanguinolenta]